ncbi:bifunctional GTP diphosphokinase/guanosine-3',5'-bis pyrophosphate 3'-pyrophosphohydrolase [Aliikangiella coralliicola]|uniref:guanosine-3',5'-bis(diphosphate) 3'-diphosphatase n=1 Tax=Aliikangiella coralliicola TaxID=2592383 RepID=A0A545UH51_9GAMM|nr:bifunctional GTP diphosphokinase/guanosine-3',5'-bis pyrophosphate 3'-pyrophosphohydrolase [Aliikangiella coralliicola]TQV88789.1 bifunctional GTP diphosphokinase/guanosine-3',5'-bis pyrophosphate 3'-pyrophosphohydrolase [Aliikangiella coralliicola]
MYLFSGLKQQLQSYLEPSQVKEIEESYVFARDAHDGQLRSSGDPYITHPVAVTKILASLHLDQQTLMAALLHDVIEDCEVTRDELAEKFGDRVAELVEGVSKLTQIKFRSREEAQAENFRKMMMAMVEDLRVVLIKLADRLHNMRTLGSLRPDKQRRIAQETIEIYAPIANRLGMYAIRMELEELGFAAKYPMRCRVVRDSVKKARGNRKEIISSICDNIQNRLDSEHIDAEVSGREKSPFSIYQKMLEKVGEKVRVFNDIMDVYGFRVITDTEDNCYRILGQLHNLYRPVPGRFKDYIAIPKTNGYQSLHTTLRGPHGLHIEVQVRTTVMDQMAENGVAAHWLYKSGNNINRAEIRAREWMRNLLELQKNTGDSLEFIESVKVDLFPDEVYLFTPNGNIIELPKGATPVDFAYAIHTDVGNSCIACKVDGKISALSSELSNGQTVEIITAPGAKPNPGWLSFVTTSKARTNIRHFIKNLRRDDAINLGRRLLEKALGVSLDTIDQSIIKRVTTEIRHTNFDDILAEIGLGQTASVIIAHRLDPKVETAEKKHEDSDRPLAIKGTEGMMIEYAKCCHPIPGDPIVGTVSNSGGFILHRQDCNNVANHRDQLDKFVPVQWEKDIVGEFRVELRVEVVNQHGVLAKVTSLIADDGVNIANIEIDPRDGTTNLLSFLIDVKHRLHLANLIRKIRLYDFVIKVSRHR